MRMDTPWTRCVRRRPCPVSSQCGFLYHKTRLHTDTGIASLVCRIQSCIAIAINSRVLLVQHFDAACCRSFLQHHKIFLSTRNSVWVSHSSVGYVNSVQTVHCTIVSRVQYCMSYCTYIITPPKIRSPGSARQIYHVSLSKYISTNKKMMGVLFWSCK